MLVRTGPGQQLIRKEQVFVARKSGTRSAKMRGSDLVAERYAKYSLAQSLARKEVRPHINPLTGCEHLPPRPFTQSHLANLPHL